MGPVGCGGRGQELSLPFLPPLLHPPPSTSAPETGHPRPYYHLICIDTPSSASWCLPAQSEQFRLWGNLGQNSPSAPLLGTRHPRTLHSPAVPFATFQGTRLSSGRATKDPTPSSKPKKLSLGADLAISRRRLSSVWEMFLPLDLPQGVRREDTGRSRCPPSSPGTLPRSSRLQAREQSSDPARW